MCSSPAEVRSAMQNLRPIGIPHSIFFENLFPKTFDSTKLEEDQQRIQQFYQDQRLLHRAHRGRKGSDRGRRRRQVPLPSVVSNKLGKGANITVTVEEGRLYHLNKINFVGVKLFRTPETLMRPIFGMSQGDVFSTAKLRKGFEDLRKLYGGFGYIDFVAEPEL